MKRPGGLYLWADERLDGGLDEQLTRWRDEGLSHDGIAAELRDRGLTVSRETVRRWLKSAAPEADGVA